MASSWRTVETGNGSDSAADPDGVGSSNKRRHRGGCDNAAWQRSADDFLRRYGTARIRTFADGYSHAVRPRREPDSGGKSPEYSSR